MIHISKRILSAVLLCTVLALAACSKKPQDRLIGAWKSANQDVEFFKDGTLKAEFNGREIAGVWSLVDDKTLKVTLKPEGRPEFTALSDFEVKGDEFSYEIKGADRPQRVVMTRLK
jgi:hypothetical protein